jgi:hypothetical protein
MPCAKLSRCVVPLAVILSYIGPDRAADAQSLSKPGRQPGELERVQMHRNSLRGVHYLSTWQPDNVTQPERFTLRVTRNINLDGDPQLNVRGGVYPLDGDGRFGFLHFNGYRVMRAYTQLGRKLWQVDNPGGKVHRSIAHRFTLAVFDADGDRGQEIVHCWSAPGTADKLLVLRDGQTGEVLKQVRLAGQGSGDECHIAAFRVAGSERPLILVAGKAADRDCAEGNWTPYFAKTMAFRPDLSKLWERTTCAAGHYAWPLDEDGAAGRRRCSSASTCCAPTGPRAACCRASAATTSTRWRSGTSTRAGAGSRRSRWAPRASGSSTPRAARCGGGSPPPRPPATRSRPGPRTCRRAPAPRPCW